MTYYEQLKSDLVYAKLRNYPDSINRALDANHIPIKVYDTLIDNARSNLPTLHRYFKLRAKMLGVKDLAYYDIYRHAWLPANLLQAQRDYFGAHTYKRNDREGVFHSHWNQ